MHIPTRKSNKKVIIIVAAILLAALGATYAAYHFQTGPFSPQPHNSVNLDPATTDQKAAGNDIKQSTLNQVENGKESSGSDPSPAPQPIEGSDKKSVGMEITAANQTATTLQVRTFIQTVTSTGTCTITMKNSQGMTYANTVDTQALSSTTTCKGFDIPLDQLSSGTWTINIDFNNDTLIASANKEITIK